jgi:simple sugar transport system ATP-binding protein
VILDPPSAGVDVAAAATILDAVRVMADGGAAIVISNLIPELRICDRVRVIADGAMTREFDAGWAEYDLVAAIEGVA